MNKKIVMLTITLLAVFLMVPSLIGTTQACWWRRPVVCESVSFQIPMEGFGITSYEYRQVGNNWITHASTYGLFTGDIEGSFTADACWIYYNWVGPDEDPYMLTVGWTNGRVLHTITATTVLGMEKTGTMKLMFIVNGEEIAGTWIIYGGTGELKGIHGRGTFAQSMDTGVIEFDGKICLHP
jgi:hypothetical protein